MIGNLSIQAYSGTPPLNATSPVVSPLGLSVKVDSLEEVRQGNQLTPKRSKPRVSFYTNDKDVILPEVRVSTPDIESGLGKGHADMVNTCTKEIYFANVSLG